MLSCRKASRLQSDSRERELSFWEKCEVMFHNRICRLCRQFGKQADFLGDAAKLYAHKNIPDNSAGKEKDNK